MTKSEMKDTVNNIYGLRKNHLTVGELLRSNNNWLSGSYLNIYSRDKLLVSDKVYNLFQTKYDSMFVDRFKGSDIYVIPEKFIYADTDGFIVQLKDIYYFKDKDKDQYTFIGYRLQDVIEYLVDKKLPCEII